MLRPPVHEEKYGLPDMGVYISRFEGRNTGLRPLWSSRTRAAALERVMNLGENRIGMRIPRSAWFLRDLRFPHSYAVSNRVHNTL